MLPLHTGYVMAGGSGMYNKHFTTKGGYPYFIYGGGLMPEKMLEQRCNAHHQCKVRRLFTLLPN